MRTALFGTPGLIDRPGSGARALSGSDLRRALQRPGFLRCLNTPAALAPAVSPCPLLVH